MNSRAPQHLFRAVSLSLFVIIAGCSPAPPSHVEITELAKATVKKYFSNLIKLQAHMEAENQAMQNNAHAMLGALGSNQSSDSTSPRTRAQNENELASRAIAEAEKSLGRASIKVTKLGEPGKADLVAPGSQIVYWPISFEASDPKQSDTTLAFTIFAYRNAAGKWDAKTKTLQAQAAGTSQEVPECMLKQLGL